MRMSRLMARWSVLALLAMPALAQAAALESGTYQVDAAHTKVGFEVPHLVISSVEGRFNKFEGTLVLDKDLAKSRLSATVEVASVDTGNSKRDDHLRSADFFDAAKTPKMTFTSKSFTVNGDQVKIAGDLTIRGVTKPVTLTGKILGQIKDPNGATKTAMKLSTVINRRDFGLVWGQMVEAGPVVGDDVTINLSIQAGKAK